MIDYVFPVFGILLTAFCALAYFRPFGKDFRDKVQKIKGFGVDLEVSVLTLFILLGVGLCFAGLFFHARGYEQSLKARADEASKLRGELEAMRNSLDAAKRIHMKLILKPEGAAVEEVEKLQDWECEYQVLGGERPVKVEIGRAYSPGQFAVTLNDVNFQTVIAAVVVRNLRSNRTWASRNLFSPLEPQFVLQREGH